MKNLFILPTDKPSRLHLQNCNLVLHRSQYTLVAQHIYITSDEIVTEYSTGLYFIDVYTGKNYVFSPIKIDKESIHAAPFHSYMNNGNMCKRIIMTTDPILISNGVQAIDDDFLEWFIKNPSCEEVEVDLVPVNEFGSEITVNGYGFDKFNYKIIIPKEEVKEVAERLKGKELFKESNDRARKILSEIKSLPIQERSYSEEDMKFAYEQGARLALLSQTDLARHKGEFPNPEEWFEQFKQEEWFEQFKHDEQ